MFEQSFSTTVATHYKPNIVKEIEAVLNGSQKIQDLIKLTFQECSVQEENPEEFNELARQLQRMIVKYYSKMRGRAFTLKRNRGLCDGDNIGVRPKLAVLASKSAKRKKLSTTTDKGNYNKDSHDRTKDINDEESDEDDINTDLEDADAQDEDVDDLEDPYLDEIMQHIDEEMFIDQL